MIERRPSRKRPALLLYTATACFLFTTGWRLASAQETQQKPTAEPAATPTEKADKPEKPAHPAQIELLETKVRFETNGDSRKEVHALVKINSELGVQQFAQLNFDFNRSFETVEIPMVHITHANGGTSDILPSAVTDHPNPAVVNAPAYQDVRVKSVRILGLQPGDTLEYRVVRTVSHHPLAPDFWLEHSFDRTGVVTHEMFQLDLPAELFEAETPSPSAEVSTAPKDLAPPQLISGAQPLQPPGRIFISRDTPELSRTQVSENSSIRLVYRWELLDRDLLNMLSAPETKERSPDVVITTTDWYPLAKKLAYTLFPYGRGHAGKDVTLHWPEILSETGSHEHGLQTLYEFISKKIKTIDLPLGATGFRTRPPEDIFSSRYATAEDKAILFLSMLDLVPPSDFLLLSPTEIPGQQLPQPNLFNHILIAINGVDRIWYLDPSIEVAPFGLVPSDLRGRTALLLNHPGIGSASNEDLPLWRQIPTDLPFNAVQKVNVEAALANDGKLAAKVHYTMRGDNELVLRVAFHHTPKERWKEVAQLLSITDGFRGQVTSVNASDPYATKEPFSVDYELDQPKFVDWSKKPVRIPALLPQLGLPDPPAKPVSGSATAPIDLGTPLEVETKMTLHLPPGTSASAPAGTSVERDYATYSSQYSVNGSTLTATRRIKFVLREVPGARAADYNAFLRAVQNDESQDFTLEKHDRTAPKTTSTAPSGAAPPKPVAPKP